MSCSALASGIVLTCSISVFFNVAHILSIGLCFPIVSLYSVCDGCCFSRPIYDV